MRHLNLVAAGMTKTEYHRIPCRAILNMDANPERGRIAYRPATRLAAELRRAAITAKLS